MLKNFLGKKISIVQVKSFSKLTAKQKGSLVGLGLKGIGSSSSLFCCDAVFGMLKKVEHLITVSVIK